MKVLREREGLTQDDFAKKYGSNVKSYWGYENKVAVPKAKFLLNLSRGIGVSPDILLSIKLKTDKSGKITNIPSRDQQLIKFKKELQDITKEFEAAVSKFFKGIESINDKIDAAVKGE